MPYTNSIANTAPGSISSGNAAAWQALLYALTNGGSAAGTAAAAAKTTPGATPAPAGGVDPASMLYSANGSVLPPASLGQPLLQNGGYKPGLYGQTGAPAQSY